METFEKIAVLDNEVQARWLDSVLANRAIPHVMVSYRDSARSSFCQGERGWGYVEATERYSDEVAALLEDLKHHSTFVLTPIEEPSQTGYQARM